LFLLAVVFHVAMRALLHKLLKCRLRMDELIFSALLTVITGVGICRFLGVNAYMGIAFFFLLLFTQITRDTSGIVCAFVLSLPLALVGVNAIERFFVYGVAVALFCKAGRLASTLALLCAFFTYGQRMASFCSDGDL
jgi:hypothetical protein